MNAALAAYSIQQEFVANELTELRAVYGVYLLQTSGVWAPRVGNLCTEFSLANCPCA
jgi:carbonic anhydrase